MLFLLALLACGPSASPPSEATAATPPPIAPSTTGAASAATTGTGPAATAPADPCEGGATYAHCALEGGAELRVCGAGGDTYWVRYLYGPQGAPTLDFPGYRDQSDARFHLDSNTYARSMETILSFGDGVETSWEIVDRVGGGGPDGEANNFQGLITKKHGTEVASQRCVGELTTDWPGLRDLLPLP